MTDDPLTSPRAGPGRRQVFRLLALAAASAAASRGARAGRAAAATPFPDEPGMLVAGPDGGSMARWAAAITPPIGRALSTLAVREMTVGGVDGVTGANQFDTRAAPDGATVLLAPGDAAMAWLVGDPRARFDVAHWLPVLAGQTPGVLAGRAALNTGQRVRIAAAGPAGPDLPALLALELLGVPVDPLFGLSAPQAEAAFARGETDVIFLGGADVPSRLDGLQGAKRLFTFGSIDDSGQRVRDPLFPDVPQLAEVQSAPGRLGDAWRATAAASQLAFGLVLPRLTPPAIVALWRHAAVAAAQAPETLAMAAASATRALAPQPATAVIAPISADPSGVLELRRWLVERYGWHAG